MTPAEAFASILEDLARVQLLARVAGFRQPALDEALLDYERAFARFLLQPKVTTLQ